MNYFLLVLFLVIGCTKSKIEDKLLKGDGIWLYSVKDVLNQNNEKTLKLKFDKNGYADEVETILFYEWKYNRFENTLMINHQEFNIVSESEDLIRLKHKKTGIEAKLSKIK